MTPRLTIGLRIFGLGLCVLILAAAQTPPQPRLLPAVGLLVQANDFRSALPGMFDKPGHERRALSGTVNHDGETVQFVFTRELDQKVRLDLSASGGQRSFAVTNLNTLLAPAAAQSGKSDQTLDQDLLEVLSDDLPEALFFSYGTAAHIRWLGSGFRTDGGTLPTSTSPLYDVFVRGASASTQSGAPMRNKSFLFDSRGKLLQFVRYQIERSGSAVNVEVAFSGWSSMSGQVVPTSITRSEGGKQVFSLTITAVSSFATQQDALFNP